MALYDTIGRGYTTFRTPDPRIAAAIDAALGDAATVANIGAGAGGYEPKGRSVVAVEPSEVMTRQRPPGAAPCIQGSAEALPLATASFDATMAILSVHHWTDREQGFREMRRVARKRVVLLTWAPDVSSFWLTEEYFPEILEHDRGIFPSTASLSAMLERIVGPARIEPVPIPHDCSDGFLCAYWRRPECYLDSGRRAAISSFARFDARAGIERLHADISSGRWARQHADLLAMESMDLGYRLVWCEVREPDGRSLTASGCVPGGA